MFWPDLRAWNDFHLRGPSNSSQPPSKRKKAGLFHLNRLPCRKTKNSRPLYWDQSAATHKRDHNWAETEQTIAFNFHFYQAQTLVLQILQNLMMVPQKCGLFAKSHNGRIFGWHWLGIRCQGSHKSILNFLPFNLLYSLTGVSLSTYYTHCSVTFNWLYSP